MDGKQINTTEIAVKLTTHGRYIWSICSFFPSSDYEKAIEEIKVIDGRLKDKFPDHAMRGSGRVSNVEGVV